MPLYTAYELCIDSEVPLHGLHEGSGTADVEVRVETLPDDELEQIDTNEQVCWGSVQRLVKFVVRDGAEITVDPGGVVDDDLLGSFITGVLMAILLRQRGLFTLHASCVAKDGVGIGFAGMSGCGKSTLAEYFHQQGYQVLCDDLLALRIGDAMPQVVAGYPHVRLSEEAGTRFVEGFDALPTLSAHGNKRLRPLTQVGEGDVALHRLYLLDAESARQTHVDRLTPGEAFQEIPLHAWATTTIADPQSKATYLQHCASLINTVPVARLRRVRTLDALPEHFDAVERDLATPAEG